MIFSEILFVLFSIFGAVSLPEGGEAIFAEKPISRLPEVIDTHYGTVKRCPADDEFLRNLGVTEKLSCRTTTRPTNHWEFNFQLRIGREVQKGEVFVLRFYAKTLDAKSEAGVGIAQPFFELAAPPHTKSLDQRVEITRDWKEYSFPFKSLESYKAEGSAIGFHLGFQPQTIEIADFQLFSYGTEFDIKKIPNTFSMYRGREPDAPWRKEAEKRIEQIRKAELTITVKDIAGRPVPDAEVEVRMKRHAFGWGSAVVSQRILQDDEDGNRYREIIEKYFNQVVFENDLKFWAWNNPSNRQQVFKALDWLRDRKIGVRGHCLVWPSWRNSSKELKDWAEEPNKIRDYFRNHIKDEVSALRGKLIHWDVVNEPYDNTDITKILGEHEIVEWFKTAREFDPDAKLYLNDYGILSAEGRDVRHQDFLEKTIRFLLKEGAPLEGLGLQSHFGTIATPPEKMLQILDRFGKLGLPITITEHDINSGDEQFQAEFTRDFLTTVFSHPSVVGVLTWGFWEKSHWLPNGAYYRSDWSIKPAGQIWLDLVTKTWWTNLGIKTDPTGKVSLRGFLGDYEITVRKAGKTVSAKVSLTKDGTQIDLVL